MNALHKLNLNTKHNGQLYNWIPYSRFQIQVIHALASLIQYDFDSRVQTHHLVVKSLKMDMV